MTFRDGLGDRARAQEQGVGVERLRIRSELALVPSFEFALRERVSRLSGFKHPSFAKVRGVERSEGAEGLTLLSEEVPGVRLTELLRLTTERGIPFDIGAALGLVRQLAPAVATLHEMVRDVAHGALSPDRIVVTPNGRPVIVETVLGAALEQLLFSRERYWSELRIALPRMAGLPRFDQLTDVTQLGAVALSLILGRQLADDEYPSKVAEVIAGLEAVSVDGGRTPLAPAMKTWLERALQLDPRGSFPSAVEARAALERAVAESGYEAAAADRVERLLVRVLGKPAATSAPAATAPAHLTAAASVVRTPPSVVPAALPEPAAPAHPVLSVQGQSAAREPFRTIAPAAATPEPSEPFERVEHESVESEPAAVDIEPARPRLRWKMLAAVFVFLAVLGGGVTVAAMRFLAAPDIAEPPAITGTLVLTSEPSGVEASIDGAVRGATPLTLTLSAGNHVLRLRGSLADTREIKVAIPAGGQVAQYVDLGPGTLPPVPAPISETNVPAPPDVLAGGDAAADPSVPAAGWLSVNARFEVRLLEGGQLLGSSQTAKIMVPAGRHDLEFVSDEIGYRVAKTVNVAAGKVSSVAIDAPNGTLSVNALPWAEVWIDGNRIGETPIGNLTLPVGSHDVVFKHPELGERHQTVVVTLKSPGRIAADFSKP